MPNTKGTSTSQPSSSLQVRTKSAALAVHKHQQQAGRNSGSSGQAVFQTPAKQRTATSNQSGTKTKTPAKKSVNTSSGVVKSSKTPKTPLNNPIPEGIMEDDPVEPVFRFRRYQKANRILIIGRNPIQEYQKLIEECNIPSNLIYGAQLVKETPYLLAYVYFKKSSFAADFVNGFSKTDIYAIHQTVKTSFRYQIKSTPSFTELCNLLGPLSQLGVKISSMNLVPATNFWAIYTNMSVKHNLLEPMDTSLITLKLVGPKNVNLVEGGIREAVGSALQAQWCMDSSLTPLNVQKDAIYLGVKKEAMGTLKIARLLFVGNIRLTNVSYKPKSSLLDTIAELQIQNNLLQQQVNRLSKAMAEMENLSIFQQQCEDRIADLAETTNNKIMEITNQLFEIQSVNTTVNSTRREPYVTSVSHSVTTSSNPPQTPTTIYDSDEGTGGESDSDSELAHAGVKRKARDISK